MSPLRARRCVASPRTWGVERGTLRHWLDLYGTGKKTAADGTQTRSPLKPSSGGSSSSRTSGAAGPVEDETSEQRIARLEGRVAELEASEKKLTTEREILRSAAKYFAGETNW
jgi:transposase